MFGCWGPPPERSVGPQCSLLMLLSVCLRVRARADRHNSSSLSQRRCALTGKAVLLFFLVQGPHAHLPSTHLVLRNQGVKGVKAAPGLIVVWHACAFRAVDFLLLLFCTLILGVPLLVVLVHIITLNI